MFIGRATCGSCVIYIMYMYIGRANCGSCLCNVHLHRESELWFLSDCSSTYISGEQIVVLVCFVQIHVYNILRRSNFNTLLPTSVYI